MRVALALAFALIASGCSDLFTKDNAPEGYACSPTGTCPPGQQCVASEHICRVPCTQTSMGGSTGPMQNGQCQNVHSNVYGSGTPYNCDYDHFCRPACMGGNNGGNCAGCQGSDVCDMTVFICRPACGQTACPSTWGCVDVGNGSTGGVGTPAMCAGCRPLATTTVMPPAFAPAVFYDGLSTSTNPLAVGDLTGSGRADVITSDGPGKKLYVFANDGTGALAPPVAYPVSLTPFYAVVADMNRDGKNDVVVATASGTQGGPVLYPGNGDHTLGAAVAGPMLPSTRFVVGDFDGDGQPDVAECGMGTSELSVVTANGTGGLKQLAAVSQPGGNTSYVRVGALDFNGDKHLDLWGDNEHGGVDAYISNGNATSLGFNEMPTGNVPGGRYDIINLDIDGDGKLDFVVDVEDASLNAANPSNVVIVRNLGGGSFVSNNALNVQLPTAGLLASGDFDGDGHVDVAMLEAQSMGKANVDILTGDGTRLLWSEQISIVKGTPSSIAVADLDGDGKPDIVVGLGSGGVAVLLNQTTR